MSDNLKDPLKPKFSLKNYQIIITIGGEIFQTNIQRLPLLKLLWKDTIFEAVNACSQATSMTLFSEES